MSSTLVNGQKFIELWPDGAPNSNGDKADSPHLAAFLADASHRTGRAIVICPGGAYSHLAFEHEGTDWAPYFNQMGISVFVLRYRMPKGHCEVPVSDAMRAIELVRRDAKKHGIDPQDIGIMGFSAGGHLASAVATHAKGNAKPNFQILFYPVITMDPSFTHRGSMENLLGEKPKKKDIREWSSDQQVTRATPRAFVALSDDDDVVLPMNGANYYQECYRHDVPCSLHIYPTGGHGWGMRPSFAFHIEMLLELKAWLNSF